MRFGPHGYASFVFDGFRCDQVALGDVTLRVRHGGAGPAIVLLHGHPRTHATWSQVAPRLADRYSVVCPDLRGYGRSTLPPTRPDHAQSSKRAMAGDVVALMRSLGCEVIPCPFDRVYAFGGGKAAAQDDAQDAALPERMYAALQGFEGKTLVMLSGADLTAQEFAGLASGSRDWQRLLDGPAVTRHTLDGADHTCSRREWHDQVVGWTTGWLRSW